MGKSSCVCVEYCRQQETRRWSMSGPSKHIVQEDVRASSSSPILGRLLRGFMPEGYPDSVTPDYLGFQVWDSIQALMSYVRGMLCSQAIMTGIGVGEQASLSSCMLKEQRDNTHVADKAICQSQREQHAG